MSGWDVIQEQLLVAEPGVRPAAEVPATTLPRVVVGELVALTDGGETPLVIYRGQTGTAALRARTIVDLHGAHIGRPVTLTFEDGDPSSPIVMGVIRGAGGWPMAEAPAQVEVDMDGERMVVSAKEQLVLRCGKACITL